MLLGKTMKENKFLGPRIPDACPVCDVLIRSLDYSAYEYFGACADCSMNFAELNRSKWEAGWRPDRQQISTRLKKRGEEPFFYRNEKYI